MPKSVTKEFGNYNEKTGLERKPHKILLSYNSPFLTSDKVYPVFFAIFGKKEHDLKLKNRSCKCLKGQQLFNFT